MKIFRLRLTKSFLLSGALTILLLFVCLFTSIKLMPLAQDDAYIHFRISENFAKYFLPYFNVSEKVMSTSSFVWTSLLAVFAFFKLSLPITIAILNPILIVIGSSIWPRLLSKLEENRKRSFLSYLFQIVYTGLLLPSALGLMETPLAFLLLGIGVLLISNNKPFGWIFFALAIFTRYEIAIYIGLFGLDWLLSDRIWKQKIVGYLYLIVPTILISAVLLGFYATILPNTLYAKNEIYQISFTNTFNKVLYSIIPQGSYPFLGIFYFLQSFQIKCFLLLSKIWQPAFYSLVGVSIASYFYKFHKRQKNNTAFILLIGGIVLAALYTLEQVLIFDWYIPIYSIPIVFGVYYYANEIRIEYINKKTENQKTNSYKFISIPIFLLMLILSLKPIASIGLNLYSSSVDISQSPTAAKGMRVQRYLEVGRVLYSLYPNANLLTSEIGGLGYSFKGEIIDGVGLITPRALAYHPMKVPQQRRSGGIGAIPAALVGREMPELVVSYPIFVEEFDSSIYRDKYTKIVVSAFSKIWQTRTGINNIWGDEELFIYIRNDIVNEQDLDYLIDTLSHS